MEKSNIYILLFQLQIMILHCPRNEKIKNPAKNNRRFRRKYPILYALLNDIFHTKQNEATWSKNSINKVVRNFFDCENDIMEFEKKLKNTIPRIYLNYSSILQDYFCKDVASIIIKYSGKIESKTIIDYSSFPKNLTLTLPYRKPNTPDKTCLRNIKINDTYPTTNIYK